MSWCYDWRMSFSVGHFALLDEVPRDSPHSFVILHRNDCLDCFCLVLESRAKTNLVRNNDTVACRGNAVMRIADDDKTW